jgi:hypothetical protein
MAVKFQKGEAVRQVIPAPIEGVIDSFKFDESSGDVKYIVAWEDVDGVVCTRSFDEDQIEAAV